MDWVVETVVVVIVVAVVVVAGVEFIVTLEQSFFTPFSMHMVSGASKIQFFKLIALMQLYVKYCNLISFFLCLNSRF